ncbi:MAG TPA: TonB family protein, partial [Candidatus Acidoferrales bacterium]|nr:TonB family protein [Candidatus Acidoferrales bacterium]
MKIQGNISPQRGPGRVPQFAVAWESPSAAFWSSFRTLLYGPAPPQGWPQGPFFRDAWVRTNFPTRALLASLLWHAFLFNVNVPYWAWFTARPTENREYPRIEVTWYVPPSDLKPLVAPSLPPKKNRAPSPPGEANKPLPPKGADAFHPRQLILSAPKLPTHPRQTLIQPDSPPEAPKILPALPNIVQWNQPVRIARPRLTLKKSQLRRDARRPLPETAAPELVAEQRLTGAINIAPGKVSLARPRLAIAASTIARGGKRTVSGDAEPAPEVAATGLNGEAGAKNIIALSANPAPPAPVVEVPPGNLSAHVVISPDGTHPGVPGGSPNGTAGATGGEGGAAGSPGGMGTGTKPGAGTGPAGISISGGDPSKLASSSGLGGTGSPESRPDRPIPASPRPDRLAARKMPSTLDPPPLARANPSPALEPIKPGASPEVLLGPKRIYTMNVNAPNMASATGSWVLQFAELKEARDPSHGLPLPLPRTDPQSDLVGPVPMRKVDPKYPPALVSARVQGDVILYAIIRKDGSVDSIQLVKGVEPRLDQNAMEALARWKFRPAERQG